MSCSRYVRRFATDCHFSETKLTLKKEFRGKVDFSTSSKFVFFVSVCLFVLQKSECPYVCIKMLSLAASNTFD